MSDSNELLQRAEQALTHWTRMYASELCNENHVAETMQFMMREGGTLYYIASLRRDILEHLKQQDHK